MSRNPAARYSTDELAELRKIHYSLVEEHVFNDRPGGAIWQCNQGHVADLPLAPVLRMVDSGFQEGRWWSNSELDALLGKIGAHAAKAIHENDADYFRRLAVILEARKEGRDLSTLTRGELLLPPRRGRAKTPRDLSRAFPVALIELTRIRLEPHATPEELTTARITRDELKRCVRAKGGTISEQELSRWISAFNFGRFMAEQPIARKPRKSG
jgi:hypothetical protein